ncbi:MAG: mechanosensitive ion channel [Thermoanaerobaculia bacterium]
MDFGDRMEATLASIVAFLPSLLAAILILVVGYLVAKLVEKATDAILEKVRFDQALDRGGVRAALQRTGTRLDPSSLVARLVFWTIMLVAILMAVNALGLTAVAAMFERLVAYIPNVIVAVLIIVAGMLIGEFVKDLIAASMGGVGGAMAMARAAKIAVVALAIFMALDQLQIAQSIVVTAFTLLLGAVALAAGLAFGLGNRELAGEYMRRWVEEGSRRAEELRGRSQAPGRVAEGRAAGRDRAER